MDVWECVWVCMCDRRVVETEWGVISMHKWKHYGELHFRIHCIEREKKTQSVQSFYCLIWKQHAWLKIQNSTNCRILEWIEWVQNYMNKNNTNKCIKKSREYHVMDSSASTEFNTWIYEINCKTTRPMCFIRKTHLTNAMHPIYLINSNLKFSWWIHRMVCSEIFDYDSIVNLEIRLEKKVGQQNV